MEDAGNWRASSMGPDGNWNDCWCPGHRSKEEARDCALSQVEAEKRVVYYPPLKTCKKGGDTMRIGYYERVGSV